MFNTTTNITNENHTWYTNITNENQFKAKVSHTADTDVGVSSISSFACSRHDVLRPVPSLDAFPFQRFNYNYDNFLVPIFMRLRRIHGVLDGKINRSTAKN